MKLPISRLLAPTLAIATLAPVRPSTARGLKALRAPEASAVPSDTLEAENEALKRRNTQLEAMMQVAQAEVHRVNVAVNSRKQQQRHGENPEALNHEIGDLRKKLHMVEADKKALVQTLRKMLAKNSTQIYQKQAARTQQKIQNLAKRCDTEQQDLESHTKEVNEKFVDLKNVSQSLQDQNIALQRDLRDVRAQMAATAQRSNSLSSDKANLVSTVHDLMRESTQLKKELQRKKVTQQAEAKELTLDKAFIANLTRKASEPAAKKQRKAFDLHHKHEESTAAKTASMKDMNGHIYRANKIKGSSASGQEPAQEVVEVEALARTLGGTEHGKGLSEWLGLRPQSKLAATGAIPKDKDGLSPIDALDPRTVEQERKAAAQKAKAETGDGGDDIDALLSQAKAQLAAMDDADDDQSDDLKPSA